MNEFHFPWLITSVLVPLIGTVVVGRVKDVCQARHLCLVFSVITFALTLCAWRDFVVLDTYQAVDNWDFGQEWLGQRLLRVDELSVPLLPLAALLHVLTTVTTLRTKMRRFSFAWSLASLAMVLAMFACDDPWSLIVFMSAAVVPPYIELRSRNKPTGVYVFHMALFVGLLIAGQAAVEAEGQSMHSLWAIVPLVGAVFIRTGIIPLHCWMTDLFENATFGTALLFCTPVSGAYAAVRLVLPVAPDWVLRSIGIMSLATAVYAAAMALVQTEARRFFCYVLLSNTALVLAGLESASALGLTGALCVWLSIGLSLGGFGVVLRALEARRGRLSLTEFNGLYEHMPTLAVCFMLTGLASVGFPGTLGFIGGELLVDAAVEAYPYIGVVVVVAAAFNGIAVLRAYFYLFTGTRYQSSISLQIGAREKLSVLILATLLIGGGLFPQMNVSSRYHAAKQLLDHRDKRLEDKDDDDEQGDKHDDDKHDDDTIDRQADREP